ncbi:MAG: magnesium transporter [Candidatus Thermoplasmatota archaeon]|nr:magnesium transporter [Candidatus Thermoplasmatota archaeon]
MTYYRAKSIIKEEFPVHLGSIAIGITGGLLLNSRIESFITIPLLLSYIPVINGIGGNVLSVFGSRLGSAIHMGSVNAVNSKELRRSTALFVIVAIAVFAIMALTLYATNPYFYGETVSMKIALIPVLAGFMLVGSLMPLTVVIAFLSFRLGMDPDNVVVPLITTIADFAGIVFLLLSMRLMGL